MRYGSHPTSRATCLCNLYCRSSSNVKALHVNTGEHHNTTQGIIILDINFVTIIRFTQYSQRMQHDAVYWHYFKLKCSLLLSRFHLPLPYEYSALLVSFLPFPLLPAPSLFQCTAPPWQSFLWFDVHILWSSNSNYMIRFLFHIFYLFVLQAQPYRWRERSSRETPTESNDCHCQFSNKNNFCRIEKSHLLVLLTSH